MHDVVGEAPQQRAVSRCRGLIGSESRPTVGCDRPSVSGCIPHQATSCLAPCLHIRSGVARVEPLLTTQGVPAAWPQTMHCIILYPHSTTPPAYQHTPAYMYIAPALPGGASRGMNGTREFKHRSVLGMENAGCGVPVAASTRCHPVLTRTNTSPLDVRVPYAPDMEPLHTHTARSQGHGRDADTTAPRAHGHVSTSFPHSHAINESLGDACPAYKHCARLATSNRCWDRQQDAGEVRTRRGMQLARTGNQRRATRVLLRAHIKGARS